jgi:signal transduction histidine kinase/ligand-binding sensor domain-containing protein/CheY-like chemotaxis protein
MDDTIAGDPASTREIETLKKTVTRAVFASRGYSIDRGHAGLAEPNSDRLWPNETCERIVMIIRRAWSFVKRAVTGTRLTAAFLLMIRSALPDHGPIRFEPLTRADGVSSQYVYQILQDSHGFLWYTTANGLNRYDGQESFLYRDFPIDSGGQAPVPGLLFEDRKGTFWVATSVLSSFSPGRGATTRFAPPHHGPATDLPVTITAIHDDAGGSLWLGATVLRIHDEIAEPVLYRFDPGTGASKAYSMPAQITQGQPGGIHAIEVDKAGRLWLGTTYGIVSFDPAAAKFVHYPHTHDYPETRQIRRFNALVWDQAGKLWVHVPAGLERFDPKTGAFDRFREALFWYMWPDPSGRLWLHGGYRGLKVFNPANDTMTTPERYSNGVSSTLADEVVTALTPDREGNVWAFFRRGGGLHRFSPTRSRFGEFLPDPGDTNSLSGGLVWRFSEDRDGSIWIATNGFGLNRYDPKSGRFTRFRHIPGDPGSPASDQIDEMYRDHSGTLWIGGVGGIGKIDGRSGRYQHLRDRFGQLGVTLLFEDRRDRFWAASGMGPMQLVDRQTGAATPTNVTGAYAVHEDRNGNLWFGAFPESLDKLEPTGNVRKISLARTSNGATLAGTSALAFYEDTAGILWIATRVGLFRFDPSSERSVRYTVRDGLPTDDIRCLLPDELGNLWIGTMQGISRFNLREKRFYNYDERDGLQGDVFNQGSCLRASDGRLYFGGNAGFNAFYPKEVLRTSPEPSVVIADFQVSGKRPLSLSSPIWETNELKLSPGQNGFSFGFIALSYVNPWKTRYRFRLDGLEKDWTEVDNGHRSARYTGVPPGDYTFRVQISRDGNTWGEKGAVLRLSIAPAWWQTPWSRGAALLALAGLIFGAFRLRVKALHERGRQLQTLVDQRTAELVDARDQAQAANRAKSAFLASMSHELRTPLNAILGFSELLREDDPSEKQSKDLEIIHRSGEHLLGLIGDVLDVAKIEAGRVVLENAPCDLRKLVREVTEMMEVRARAKNLQLLVEDFPYLPGLVLTDASKLRQILINLIGNAVRYTDRGSISLRLEALPEDTSNHVKLRFEVEDTGVGIAPEDQARIFEPFVQVGNRTTEGTGLGLTIVRQFVEMMGGTIQVESTPGHGSRFRVELRVERAMNSEANAAPDAGGRVVHIAPGQPEYRVLVVDDAFENRLLMQRVLEAVGFRVRAAQNGMEELEVFGSWRPHFIWTDRRMPGMDGVEAVKRIRELDGGRAVKIAGVTASVLTADRDEMLAAGMDDVLQKPYNFAEVFNCMSRHLGVRYVRAEGTAHAKMDPPLREALMALSDELRSELSNALISLDRERIAGVIQRVSEQDASLGAMLANYADRLAYSKILKAIQSIPDTETKA